MATTISVDHLRDYLQTPADIASRAFDLLKAITALVNDDSSSDLGREMVLRALDQRAHFGQMAQMLDALAHAVGLYPYLDPDSLRAYPRTLATFKVTIAN